MFDKLKYVLVLTMLVLLPLSGYAELTEEEQQILSTIQWNEGPYDAPLGERATMRVGENLSFINGDDTNKLNAVLFKDAPYPGMIGMIYHEINEWRAEFSFEETGYIPDDEKDSLDADAILESMQEGQKEANTYRVERGGQPLNLVGWAIRPYYNETTNNLEWAIIVENEATGTRSINYNIRMLGRRGVVEATLVCSEATLDRDLPEFRSALQSFSYNPGEKYTEYVQGDRVAEYGLTALVAGGAAAVAAKSGLFKYLWKILVGVGVLFAAGFRKIFVGKSRDQ